MFLFFSFVGEGGGGRGEGGGGRGEVISNVYGFNLGRGQVKNFLMKRGSLLILLVLSHQTPPAQLPHKK